MHESDKMLVALRREIVDHREVERGAIGEIDRQFVIAVFKHVVEDRAAPVLRGVALVGRSIFERVALVGFGVVPAKSVSLEYRVQRIDQNEPARQLQPFGTATLAEAADQIVLWQTSETLADQPVHQAQTGREFHAVLCRAIMPDERMDRSFPEDGSESR